MRRKLTFITIAAISLCVLFPMQSSATIITFDNDNPGVYPNPFTSVDSDLVNFSEVGAGAVGQIGVNPNLSTSNVLDSSMGPGAPDAILMEFLIPVSLLSFDMGDSRPSGYGDVDGWLRVFDGATLIAESRVLLNSNDLFDQSISYSGSPITSALYAKVKTGSSDLGLSAESIDNVLFNPVPLPATMLLFGTGLVALVGIGRKKK